MGINRTIIEDGSFVEPNMSNYDAFAQKDYGADTFIDVQRLCCGDCLWVQFCTSCSSSTTTAFPGTRLRVLLDESNTLLDVLGKI